jgi:hypothetical protein
MCPVLGKKTVKISLVTFVVLRGSHGEVTIIHSMIYYVSRSTEMVEVKFGSWWTCH